MDPQDKKKTAIDHEDPIYFQETLEIDGSQDTAPKQQPAAESLQKTFGRYRMLKILGVGAMGAVYLAHDETLDREVALKIPKFSADFNDSVVKRFFREARSAAVLTHPNICAIYDVGEIDGKYYIAMQYVAGHSLADYVNSARRQPQDQVAIVIRKIALAMHEAHSHDLVHRDLKPANIMIDHRGEPVVMDFGLAKRSGQEDMRITRDGSIAGSPAYMSPEQLEGKVDDVDPRADIYSLGVVLYEGLTGDLPFKGTGSVISLITEVVTGSPPSPDSVRDDLEPRLCKVCLQAMDKNPLNRYQTMQEFAQALGQFIEQYSPNAAARQNNVQPESTDARDSSVVSPSAAIKSAEEQCRRVRALIGEKKLEEALKLLEEIAGHKDLEIASYAEWAARELPRVRSVLDLTEEKNHAGGDLFDLPSLESKEVWDDGPTSSQLTINPLSEAPQEDIPSNISRLLRSKAAIVWIAVGTLAGTLILIVALVAFGATGS